MITEKVAFLRNEFIPLMQHLQADAKGKWGVMNGQQMAEHFIDALCIANGKLFFPLITPAEQLPKYHEFLLSEKPFKENTKSPLMSREPQAIKYASMEAVIAALQKELDYFFWVFENDSNLKTRNAIFGDLDYEQNILLLHKHAMHHLKQFGLIEN